MLHLPMITYTYKIFTRRANIHKYQKLKTAFNIWLTHSVLWKAFNIWLTHSVFSQLIHFGVTLPSLSISLHFSQLHRREICCVIFTLLAAVSVICSGVKKTVLVLLTHWLYYIRRYVVCYTQCDGVKWVKLIGCR